MARNPGMSSAVRLGAIGALALAGAAHAQGGPERVDAGTGDVGPLSESLRVLPLDLRVSDGFENVYRVTGPDGQERFMRREGALTAVFPRSDYVMTEFGPYAVIPAGTWFMIGEPLGAPNGSPGYGAVGVTPSALALLQRIDRRVGTRPGGGARVPGVGPSALAPTPWRSERARAEAVTRLLVSAAESE